MTYRIKNGKQIAKVLLNTVIIAFVVVILFFMITDLLNIHKCSICDEVLIGKGEAWKDKPVCDRCYSICQYRNGDSL